MYAHISNFSNLHVVCIMSYFYKIFFLTYLLCKLKGGPSVAKGDCLKCFISAVGCPPRTICSAIDSPGGPFLWGTSYSMTVLHFLQLQSDLSVELTSSRRHIKLKN